MAGGPTLRTLCACVLAALTLAAGGCERKSAPETTAGSASGGSPPPARDRVLVGHVAVMSGEEATFGQSTDRGIRLAVNEQNARGGVKGHVVELRTLDDRGRPEEAAVAATRLASEEHVAVLLGEVASSRSLAMATVADAYHVPMISPASTGQRVIKEGDKVRPYVFRVCFGDRFEGAAMARFAREHLRLDRAAILRDATSEDSVALADAFLARFKELGGTVVDDEVYRAGDREFQAVLAAVRAKDPQAIYVPGSAADVALIARDARELGLAQPLLGANGWHSTRLLETGGRFIDGSYFSSHAAPEDPEPRAQEFVKHYKQAWGEAPDARAALGYDAARVALDAMARAPELTGAAIKDAIAATRGFPGVTGAITIDADHEVAKPAVVLEVRKGAARHVTTVRPP